MMSPITASLLCLWLVVGCVDVAESEELPPAPAMTEVSSSSVATVEVLMPDESGRVHRGVAVVSRNIAKHVDWFLEGTQAVERPEAMPRSGLSYQERLDQASSLMNAATMAADSKDRVLLAVVFEEDTMGWRGTMKPAKIPEPAQAPDDPTAIGGCACNSTLFVSASQPYAHSADYICNGAFAYGNLSAGSTGGAAMKFFTNAPWPLGSQIFATLNISPSNRFYIWGLNNVYAFYYVDARHPGTGGAAQITNTMYCY